MAFKSCLDFSIGNVVQRRCDLYFASMVKIKKKVRETLIERYFTSLIPVVIYEDAILSL